MPPDEARNPPRTCAAEFFAGHESLDRLVASGMTLLAALPIAVTMIVLGSALIVLQFAFVILSRLARVFPLVGIHRGGGRNALLRWLDMWLGTLVKRVALTGLISVLVSLFAFDVANLGSRPWSALPRSSTARRAPSSLPRQPAASERAKRANASTGPGHTR